MLHALSNEDGDDGFDREVDGPLAKLLAASAQAPTSFDTRTAHGSVAYTHAELARLIEVPSLCHVQLTEQQWTSLPPVLFELPNLESLSIVGATPSAYRELPPSPLASLAGIERLTNLRSLTLIDKAPELDPGRELERLADLPELTTVRLGEAYGRVVPSARWLPSVIRFVVSDAGPDVAALYQALAEIPTIRIFEHKLWMHDKLHVPDPIGALTWLTALSLRAHRVRLPSAIGKLTELLELSIGTVTTLPDELGALAKLTRLEIRGPKLKRLPPTLYALKNLVEIQIPNGLERGFSPQIRRSS